MMNTFKLIDGQPLLWSGSHLPGPEKRIRTMAYDLQDAAFDEMDERVM